VVFRAFLAASVNGLEDSTTLGPKVTGGPLRMTPTTPGSGAFTTITLTCTGATPSSHTGSVCVVSGIIRLFAYFYPERSRRVTINTCEASQFSKIMALSSEFPAYKAI